MKIGKYKLYAIDTGSFGLDGGAMYGVVPKTMWSKFSEPDELNRVTLHARILLLVSESRKILIDTGVGDGWDEKFSRIYRYDQNEYALGKSLDKLGIQPNEITDVLLTHLHFDHTGGATILHNGKWMPTFPNAKYYIQKKHFDWAMNPNEKDRASFVQQRFVPLYQEGLLNFVNGGQQFDDEIEFIPINGHTFSQQMIKISDLANTVLFCADLFAFTSHLPIPYVMGYDLQPLVTIEEKKKFLPLAAEQNWKLFFEHDPEVVIATVTQSQQGFSLDQVYTEML
jgi:glyoxylase-like metal-dependent hydrolase (beta-lactamase superfamily II)